MGSSDRARQLRKWAHKQHKKKDKGLANLHPQSQSKSGSPAQPSTPPPHPPDEPNIPLAPPGRRFSGRRIDIILLIASLIAGYFLYNRYKTLNKKSDELTPHQVAEAMAKHYFTLEPTPDFLSQAMTNTDTPKILGILLDPKSLAPNYHNGLPSGTWFVFGHLQVAVYAEDLMKGIQFRLPFINTGILALDTFYPIYPHCTPSTINFGIKDGKLYAACKLQDLITGDAIGEVAYDHWKVFLPDRLRYVSDEQRLEIIDADGNIVLSLRYVGGQQPMLYIGGYLRNNESCVVIPNYASEPLPYCFCNTIYDPQWLEKASDRIDSLVTVYPELQHHADSSSVKRKPKP